MLEQFELGNPRGSSHGAARIARSTYHDPEFARLMQEALRDDWPRLEADAGETLLHRTPGCIFGPEDGEIATYERACSEAGVEVRRVDAAESKRLFPAFDLDTTDEDGSALAVLSDETAAVVAAARTIHALARLAVRRGAEIRENTRVLRWTGCGESPLALETVSGTVLCEKLVVCAGPWTAALLPHLAPRLFVLGQRVGYYSVEAPEAALRPGAFPVWVRLGRGPNELLYGLPQFESAGIKIARHRTLAKRGDSPDRMHEAEVQAEELQDLERFLQRYLRWPLKRFEAGERCFYTMTSTEEFILGPLPQDPRVIVGAGFSGHSFKFAPTTGRILAGHASR